jgi:Domain of unknown function (DUF4145)
MIPDQKPYTDFARSLYPVDERDETTQLVFSVAGHNFCWITKNNSNVQLFPPLGKGSIPTRRVERQGRLTLCIRSSNDNVDAQYDDPDGILKPLWNYVGFRLKDCSFDYGCNLIRQAYEQVSGKRRNFIEHISPSSAALQKADAEPMHAAISESQPIEVAVKEVVLKLEDILDKLEPKLDRNLYQWITDLQAKGVIPRPVADMMHTIRTLRNNVAHSNHLFNKHDRTVLESAWLSVQEWCAQKRHH